MCQNSVLALMKQSVQDAGKPERDALLAISLTFAQLRGVTGTYRLCPSQSSNEMPLKKIVVAQREGVPARLMHSNACKSRLGGPPASSVFSARSPPCWTDVDHNSEVKHVYTESAL
eukprot:1138678-Pelagomonas_calceolata.AAC.2